MKKFVKKALKFLDIELTVVFLAIALFLPYPSAGQSVFGILTILTLGYVALKRWVKI